MENEPSHTRDRTEFGQRLLAARKHAGLTQKDLALRSGLSQSNVAYLEAKGNASEQTWLLAQICGVRSAWLAKAEGPMLGPESEVAAAGLVANEAIPAYLGPNDPRDYRTIVHTLAASLEESGITLSVKQFLALADDIFRRFGK